jgi:adenylate kinase
MARELPNILVTGTPGTGKTSFTQMLASATATKHAMKAIHVSDWIKEKNLHDGHDPEYDAYILNDDKVYSILL